MHHRLVLGFAFQNAKTGPPNLMQLDESAGQDTAIRQKVLHLQHLSIAFLRVEVQSEMSNDVEFDIWTAKI
jgi:hypothetical protein